MFLKEFEKLNQEPKGCSWQEEKTKVILTLFFLLFIWVNLWPLSTFVPWRKWRGKWKKVSIKYAISIKNIFWVVLGPKIMSSLNTGCNTSIRAYYLCKPVSSSQGYQNYSGRLFYIYQKPSWKNVIAFWSHITWSCVYFHW